MQIILQKASFNDNRLKRYISTITVNELNSLSQPCYYPDWKKHYYELLSASGLKEKDVKEFVKRFYLGSKIQDALLQSDPGSNLLVVLMYHFILQKDKITFSTLMIYHMIRQYGNFIRRVMKFCKPEVFAYTLNNLNPTHLFVREKTIPNAIYHLSNEMQRRYTEAFIELNPEKISAFLYESRGRIAQSLRSFAEAYYENDSKGFGIGTQKELETGEEIIPQEIEKGSKIGELIAQRICVYKEIDYNAFNEAKKITRINTSIGMSIIKDLQKLEFVNDIKFIIELFIKDIKGMNELCGPDFVPYVKRLMGLKRTTKTVYFKQEIYNLLLKVIKGSQIESKYNSLTLQTQFQINSFLAFYITYYIKNVVC